MAWALQELNLPNKWNLGTLSHLGLAAMDKVNGNHPDVGMGNPARDRSQWKFG